MATRPAFLHGKISLFACFALRNTNENDLIFQVPGLTAALSAGFDLDRDLAVLRKLRVDLDEGIGID